MTDRRHGKRQRAHHSIQHSAFTVHRSPAQPAPCVHFPNCVGCTLIGKPYGEQLRIKQQRVQAAFATYPSLAALEIPQVIGSPQAFGYRTQAKLVVRRAARGLLLGIYRPGSHQVVDIRACPVHHPLINRVLGAVAAVLEQYDIPIYDERGGAGGRRSRGAEEQGGRGAEGQRSGGLRYVVVRVSNWSKSAQIILVTYDRRLPRLREVARRLQRMRGVASVVQNVNPDPGNVILGTEFVALTHETALMERVGGLKLKTHAGAFLQANVAVARKLYAQALRWAAPSEHDTCADLFCGVGALTFHLATAAHHVAGIEASPIAVADAKENIRVNGFHNVRFYCGEVGQVLPEVATRLGRIDIVTLNPPRKGADEATRRAIAACAPQRIVYVSCEPTTLARDLEWCVAHGYAVTHVQPFDLLPQTEHVECVVALERSPQPAAPLLG